MNPTTGVVSITNAYPAGVYPIAVKVQGISGFTNTFMLTVNDAVCSQGIFSGTVNNALNGNPYSIVLGDFNKDGKEDFATANYTGNNVSIGIGDGAGNFTIVQTLSNMDYLTSLAVGDFNSDGNADLVLAGGSVYIRYGTGTGTFTGTYSIITTGAPRYVATGDFNGDGRADFVTANYLGNSISVYIGDGAGAFNQLPAISVGIKPICLLINDYNSDGKQDIVVANSGSQFVSVLAGNGNGSFTALPDIAVSNYPQCLVADDINSDGKQDLLVGTNVGGNFAGSVIVLTGNGNGSFTTTTTLDMGGGPSSIATADFNGDGKADLATVVKVQSAVIIRLGDGTGGFAGNSTIIVPSTVQDIAVGDLNGDSKLDFVTSNYNGNTFSVRLNSDKEIDLLGNGNAIPTGSNTPQTINLTNFGAVPTGNLTTNTYTIQNTGTANLIINNISITGTDSTAFTVGGISFPLTIAARSSTTFTLAFAADGNGVKTARVNVLNNDCDEGVYSFAVRGLVTCVPASTPNVWLGNTTDWNLGSNWSLGMPPGACTRAVINAGLPFMPEISGQAVCYSLTLSNGATIIVRTGGNLNITSNG